VQNELQNSNLKMTRYPKRENSPGVEPISKAGIREEVFLVLNSSIWILLLK